MDPLLERLAAIPFPPLRRAELDTVQVNLGYRCNQACGHCHVNAGPNRSETMDDATAATVLRFARLQGARVLDLTGGAPEVQPVFRWLVRQASAAGMTVIDRCNLTILEEPDQADLAEFLAAHAVTVIASLPCYLADNVDSQRGRGVFDDSLRGLRRLNAVGYGQTLPLHLVHNPLGPFLPPPQTALEADYRQALATHGIVFNRLLTLTNLPVARFAHALLRDGQFDAYLALLRSAHQPANLDAVMCRSLVSVDWQGRLYDCDFNQMLGVPLGGDPRRANVYDGRTSRWVGQGIAVAGHCYGCTAGQGSSCGGALQAA